MTSRVKLTPVTSRPLVLATLDGFAVEGGLDMARSPSTSYYAASALGQCSTPGDAAGLWENYESVLDHVAPLGLSGIRLTVEWARIEPREDGVDLDALSRYANVLRRARDLDLRSTVVVIDAALPAWLGPDAWIMPWVPPRLVKHAELVGNSLGELCDSLMLFARPHELISAGYITGHAPPWRKGAAGDAKIARSVIDELRSTVAQLDAWRGHGVARSCEIPLVSSAAAMTVLFEQSTQVDEIHLRSLVRGAGPTAAARGLLENVDGQWNVTVASDVMSTWCS